ncbi:GTP-binding protein [Romboutsia sedimentorum]|uniref:CobW family GTP-binding protein n=1 Tax=Romboutsia sedimentorum TaxID=1368474 RepID=UPI0024DE000D|nr:CobW family GTP-binding protein [Romboutsia sedimentorum]MDK2585387.1 GTP-binding protein [Romboutsia sedimentorum]
MIKLDIISGFLGSGKTTLIKKILDFYKNEKIVVIENEFGEIGIDANIIQKDGLDIIELQNGCICCSMKLNFKDTILKVAKEFNPERIIIEPTGIAMLSEILSMLNDDEIKLNFSINSLVTVVDAINYFDYIDNFGEFFEDQILNAKTLLLSKNQFLKDENRENLVKSLKGLNQNVDIINKNWDDLLVEDLLVDDMKNKADEKYKKIKKIDLLSTNMKSISSVSISNLKINEAQKIEEIFDDFNTGKYGKILRAKGFLNSVLDNTLEFNYVNGQYNIKESDIKTSSKICIIGSKLQKDKLKNIFK